MRIVKLEAVLGQPWKRQHSFIAIPIFFNVVEVALITKSLRNVIAFAVRKLWSTVGELAGKGRLPGRAEACAR